MIRKKETNFINLYTKVHKYETNNTNCKSIYNVGTLFNR